jgi:hypothetical protein
MGPAVNPASLQRVTSTSLATIVDWCTSIHYPVNGTPSWRQFMDKALYRAYVAMQQNNKREQLETLVLY